MNIGHRQKIVLLGMMSHFPVAGVVWQTLHYLIGFQRLGFDPYYVEAHGCTPSKLMRDADDDGALRAAGYIAETLGRFDLGNQWAYHDIYGGNRCYGMTELQLKELFGSAAWIFNLHGGHLPQPSMLAHGRLVYLETDPVEVQIDLDQGSPSTEEFLAPHCAFFTFGENFGHPDCRLPVSQRFQFRPTRQPVVLDFWNGGNSDPAEAFTTIGNWRQPWRERKWRGERYTWSKHFEFLKFIGLPGRVRQPFELAMASYSPEDQELLESKGWRVRDALEISRDCDAYRQYIRGSRAEFTVAKDQNIRLRSGWFSDRAATYLAAGRPVVTQETGFSNCLPTGAGLFAFSKMDEIVAAVETINADYPRQCRAASEIAREYFSHEVVLKRLLADLGQTVHPPKSAAHPEPLLLSPTSRWPTRLPEATVQTVMAWPVPVAATRSTIDKPGFSIVIVTYNSLVYTKMCLHSLLTAASQPDHELIIVDNASTDGTVDYLREVAARNPHVRVIANEINRGFAAANNQGLAVARGAILVLLNNDTIVMADWLSGLKRVLTDPAVGLVGPVTNRTCNEAQIDAPYRTNDELAVFVSQRTRTQAGTTTELAMLAMFCVAMRREVFAQVGPLDERFGIGMFEDDDYARRVRQAGYRIVCAEDTFVHHFGQASVGELCRTGEYDRLFETNRRRFEEKWGVAWEPHKRRITPEYDQLRQHIRALVTERLPADAVVFVVSKGDNEILPPNGRHFPQTDDGQYANIYPADSAEALQQLAAVRARGGSHLLLPKPGYWWLEHYQDFAKALGAPSIRDESCLIFSLNP